MQTNVNSFSTVAQKIGFGTIAKLAGVGYQAVSRMAADPRPGYKYHIRRRILDSVIELSKQRAEQLRKEADEVQLTVKELEQWKADQFGH